MKNLIEQSIKKISTTDVEIAAENAASLCAERLSNFFSVNFKIHSIRSPLMFN